jgi:hypothetical protein
MVHDLGDLSKLSIPTRSFGGTMRRWEERIEEARQRMLFGAIAWRRFTAEERKLAGDWRTCAVGEMRRRYGVRLDRNLGWLGMAFFRAVLRNDVEGAATTGRVIEEYAVRSKRREWEAARAKVTTTNGPSADLEGWTPGGSS